MAGTMSLPRACNRLASSLGSRAVSMCASAAAARRSSALLLASSVASPCGSGSRCLHLPGDCR